MNAPTPPAIRHSAWNIWLNPIFRRYCQSRLRIRDLGITLLLTILVAGFLFAMATSFGARRSMDAVDAARNGIIPLLVLQALILFVLGTAQVAGGMTAERDEGVIDYQRLIPMSPLAKVMGYLFGLPVREYVLFLATMPLSIWCLWQGRVTWNIWLPIYGVLFSSTLLYHLTGLITGTVVRNRRWAFLTSIALVFSLYTVIPQMANFGLVFFKYLTITPVFTECLPGILPKTAGSALKAAQHLLPTVKFFNLDFSEAVFTLFSQSGLALTFVVMLCRKWRRQESHLLGKLWATGFFLWIQILLLGNAIPLIEPGSLFPSQGFAWMSRIVPDWAPAKSEAVLMSGIYGLVTLGLLWVLSGIITASGDHQLKGWRRVRKQGLSAMPTLADAATGFFFTATMAVAGALGWYWFTRALVESSWFPGHRAPWHILGVFLAVLLAAGLGFQALLERKGGRATGLAVILVGVFPLMAGAVLGMISERLYPIGAWLVGMSPLSMPFFAAATILSISELPATLARAVPRSFCFWLAVWCVSTPWLGWKLWEKRSTLAARCHPDAPNQPSIPPSKTKSAGPVRVTF